MKLIKNIVNFLFNLAFVAILVVVISTYFKFPLFPQFKLYAVISQSMKPTLYKGDLIIIKQENIYKIGDIITFKNSKGIKKSDTITHRLTKINKDKKNIYFQTKGDANNAVDDWKISSNNVLGREIFRVPLIGTLFILIKTPYGLVFLVIIPATIIIYTELINIKKELVKFFIKKSEKLKV